MIILNIKRQHKGQQFKKVRANHKVYFVIGCEVLAMMASSAGATQVRLEEVVVTAQKQEENIQTVPLAITVITNNDLQRQGITTVGDVIKATPSIFFTPFPSSSNTPILYMRGMGNSNPALLTSEGAVGLYEDGFIIARPNAATFDLADVERVEVLRGPQGTLYVSISPTETSARISIIGGRLDPIKYQQQVAMWLDLNSTHNRRMVCRMAD
jgi:outer membrane receptor for ferrienterochelin and colicin